VLFVNLQFNADFPTHTTTTTQTPPPTKTPPITQDPDTEPTVTPNNPEVGPASQDPKDIGVTALIGSIITSVTSLVGFITTTVITWRREKREASLAEVQRKKLETELEKSRLELEELKKSKVKKRNKKQ